MGNRWQDRIKIRAIDKQLKSIEKTNHYIYSITCVANGKRYIGKTSNIKNRISNHYNNLKNDCHCNRMMQYDFNSYGEDAFEIEVLGVDYSCGQWERTIQFLAKTYDPNIGYNYNDMFWRNVKEKSLYKDI